MWCQIIELSKNNDNDEYDKYGRNISAQKRRQSLEPWTTVSYKSKKKR